MRISDAFSSCHDQLAKLLTYALLEFKWFSGKKEKFLFYQISDQATSNNYFWETTDKGCKEENIILAPCKCL